MTTMTIDYTVGETKTWRAIPRTSAGEMADLTAASAELRISVSRDVCLPLVATADDRGFAFALDPAALALPVGRYAAGLWIRWPDGETRAYGQFVLQIRKGC